MTHDPDLLDLLDAIATRDWERRIERCGSLIRYAIASELVRRGTDEDAIGTGCVAVVPLFVLTVYGAEVHACVT